MTFWLIAAFLALACSAWLARALLRNRKDMAAPAEFDLQVYRDQLKEVDKDRARGVISEEDAERTRIEISRRILEADRAAQAETGAAKAPKGLSYGLLAVAVAILVGGSLALYDRLGAPGYPDLPLQARKDAAEEFRKTRPTQADAEAQVTTRQPTEEIDPKHIELVEQLREVVKQRPDDVQGLTFLARNEAALGNYKAAYEAQQRVIALKGENTVARDYAMLSDLLILAAGGYVSPEAEQAISQTLARDRTNGTALYYAGLMYAQTGRPDVAFAYWRPLLEASPPDAPWIEPIRAQIGEAAFRAGIEYQLPPERGTAALPGPSAEDMEAAAEMSAEDRMDMIRGMVERLGSRLAEEGGTAEEWARLINALAMLGETDRASAIWAEAQDVFADKPDQLATVAAAAKSVGVAE